MKPMGRPVDRDPSFMRSTHGTTKLITDYEPIGRNIACVDPAQLRNSEDYDDWEYGTEPIPGDATWKRNYNTNT